MSYQRKNGFSLIELLVVIAVLLIVALIGYPLMSKQLQKNRLKAFSADVININTLARTYAWYRQEDIYVVVDTQHNCIGIADYDMKQLNCICYQDDSKVKCSYDGVEYNKVPEDSTVNVSILPMSDQTYIHFNGQVKRVYNPISIYVQHNDNVVQISVSPTGSLSTCSSQLAAYPNCNL